MMNQREFENLVMSKVEPGPFKPFLVYHDDDDALEVVISSETYRTQAVKGNGSVSVYIGRDSGDVVGVRITGVSQFTGRSDQMPFQVQDIHDGKVKTKRLLHLFESIRESAKDEGATLGVFMRVLEKRLNQEVGADEYLEACLT